MSFGLNFKLLKRYREIIGILVKYGFQDILAQMGVSTAAKIVEKVVPSSLWNDVNKYTKWERIRMACEELGTTYIKFAQILSNRPDIIPPELINEFEKLQSAVPPFESEKAREIIETECQCKIEDLFDYFESEPFASASIAQVHKAKLKSGDTIVLKVRRPDIMDKVELDIMIMKYFAREMNERGYLSNLDPVGIVRAFDQAIHKEVDLTHEGYNLQRFSTNFQGSTILHIPKYYPQYTTQRLLTMEFVDGIHPYDNDKLQKAGINKHQLVVNGMYALFQQIFEHGFFHADPHPGNMFAMPGNKVCFIDFGMMGTVLKRDVEFFADIVYGITAKDSKRVIWGLKNIAVSQKFEGVKSFDYDVEEIIQDYHSLRIEQINMTELFKRLLTLVNKYEIKMPPDYFLLSKCLVTIEGVGHRLDPNLNIIEELTPHINKTIQEELNVLNLLKKIISSMRDSMALFENLPNDLREIIGKVKKGEMKVSIQHEGLDEMTRKIDMASNRITGGFLIGCILIASAALIAVKFPPLFKHVSIIGATGFFIANILGLKIIYDIFKSKRL